MLRAMPSAHVKLTASVAALAFVVVNVMFYFLSTSYFAAHMQQIVPGQGMVTMYTPEMIAKIRMSFALFSAIVAVGCVLSQMWPRAIGHSIPTVLGIGYIVAACFALSHGGVTAALPVTLIITGALMPVLAHFSFHHRSRGSWAFLVSICGVFAVVEFFGAPKLRGALDVGLWTTMILPGLNAVAVLALVTVRGQYVDRAASTARAAA